MTVTDNRRFFRSSNPLGTVLVANQRQLPSRDVLCSKHFRKEDIGTHYITILADGTIHSLERERWRLQANAVPINLANNVKCADEIEEGPADSNSAMENATLSTIMVGSNEPNMSPSSVSGTNGTSNKDEKPLPDIDMAMDIEDKCNAYNIECLPRDVKGAKWREGWGWSSEASSIEFVRFDAAKLHLTVHCHISANMTLEISAANKTADSGIDGGPIRAFDDLIVLLDMMKKLQPCVGTGYKAEVLHSTLAITKFSIANAPYSERSIVLGNEQNAFPVAPTVLLNDLNDKIRSKFCCQRNNEILNIMECRNRKHNR